MDTISPRRTTYIDAFMNRICWVLVLVFCSPSSFVWAQDTAGGTISVSGEAVVKVVPDRIVLLLGIETWDLDIQVAKEKNEDILGRTLNAVLDRGVASTDTQTDHLSIEPRYNSDYRKENLIGYFVRNTLSVTLSDPSEVEALLTDVLRAGITHIHGVHFETTAFKEHRETARRLALEAAREKATQMANVLGKRVGEPRTISEGPAYGNWFYVGGGWGFGRSQGMSQNVVQNAGGSSPEGMESLSLGKISIRGSVSVTFNLE